jgi:hypothetical protein
MVCSKLIIGYTNYIIIANCLMIIATILQFVSIGLSISSGNILLLNFDSNQNIINVISCLLYIVSIVVSIFFIINLLISYYCKKNKVESNNESIEHIEPI